MFRACNTSIEHCQAFNAAQTEVIRIQDEHIEIQTKEIARLRSEASSISPVLFFGLGVLVGGATVLVLGRN
jgi:hypothetical protein